MAFQYVENPPEFRELLKNIFSDEFMQKNTRFDSFEGFQYSSAVFVNWKSDLLVYDENNLDAFVKESTCFSSWEEMVYKATDICFKK